jgi:hypothetical protein
MDYEFLKEAMSKGIKGTRLEDAIHGLLDAYKGKGLTAHEALDRLTEVIVKAQAVN